MQDGDTRPSEKDRRDLLKSGDLCLLWYDDLCKVENEDELEERRLIDRDFLSINASWKPDCSHLKKYGNLVIKL